MLGKRLGFPYYGYGFEFYMYIWGSAIVPLLEERFGFPYLGPHSWESDWASLTWAPILERAIGLPIFGPPFLGERWGFPYLGPHSWESDWASPSWAPIVGRAIGLPINMCNHLQQKSFRSCRFLPSVFAPPLFLHHCHGGSPPKGDLQWRSHCSMR